ncbi:MAG: PorV/PorQ family protein [Bacteroidota bacterium]
MKSILVVALAFCCVPAAWAQSGLAFLRLGPNAEAQAMGDAQVAVSKGAFSSYWNPAGLAHDTGNQAGVAHHIWIGDTRTYNVFGRFAAGKNAGWGLFAHATGVTDLQARTRPGEPDGFFDVQFVSTGVAYGRAFGPLRLGASVKYLSERIFAESANGYAFDFGAQLTTLGGSLSLGGAVQHLGAMDDLNVVATPLPRTARAGIAFKPFQILGEQDGVALLNVVLIAEVSHLFPEEGGDLTQLHLGTAVEVLDLVTVRAGYLTDDNVRSVTLGGGVVTQGLRFDYALLPFANGFGGPGHILTLGYGW